MYYPQEILFLISDPIPQRGSFTYGFQVMISFTFQSSLSRRHHGSNLPWWSFKWKLSLNFSPLAIIDWFHIPASELFFVKELLRHLFMVISGLVNGKNMFNGSGEYCAMTFAPDKRCRIRLVNTSTNAHFKFWTDEHTIPPSTTSPLVIHQNLLPNCRLT